MAKEYDNTNRGSLFKNTRPPTSDKSPQYGGTVNIEGVEYYVSGWLKEGKSGKFFSLSFTAKDSQARRPAKPSLEVKGGFDDTFEDDDIPF